MLIQMSRCKVFTSGEHAGYFIITTLTHLDSHDFLIFHHKVDRFSWEQLGHLFLDLGRRYGCIMEHEGTVVGFLAQPWHLRVLLDCLAH